MSTISSTDVEIFKRLTNSAIVDISQDARARRVGLDMARAMAATDKAEEADDSAPTPPSSPKITKPRTSLLQKAEATLRHNSPATSAASSPRSMNTLPATTVRVSKDASLLAQPAAPLAPMAPTPPAAVSGLAGAAAPVPAAVPTAVPTAVPAAAPASAPRTAARAHEESEDGSDSEASTRGAAGSGSSAQERLEKQGYLIELANLRQKGIELSRRFSMRDSIAEMQFEVEKQTGNQTTRSHVNFMKDSLRFILNGIEMGNAQFGPFLSIDGWAETATRDMNKYDHALERIYKRYWRKNEMSPIMELGWMLISSLVVFHLQNKFFGAKSPGAMSSPKPAPPTAASAAPSKRRGEERHPPEKAARGRPTLRPPAGLFGR